MRYLAGLGYLATAAASCTLVLSVASVGFGADEAKRAAGATPSAITTNATRARRTTTRFLSALDRNDFAMACGLLSKSFYRQHPVASRAQCVAALRMTMSGTTVS